MSSVGLAQRVWALCQTLRDDGVSYGDYLQQLTLLLFLKMADESDDRRAGEHLIIPVDLGWQSLRPLHGPPLKERYEQNLVRLSKLGGALGAIYDRASNRIEDANKLRHLLDLIDEERWFDLGEDVKGDMYEGLLQRNAEDVKSGAGQYFTPRALIEAIVESVAPEPFKTVADPACGTGGFFLGVNNWFKKNHAPLSMAAQDFLRHDTFYGNEIVLETRRLALMNLMLHGIGDVESEPSISRSDALDEISIRKFDYVFANPPFGKKSSFASKAKMPQGTHVAVARSDFWEVTGSKQLDFLQHIYTMLRDGGEAAVVLPDNVLFEGGAAERIRLAILKQCDVHTLLRLPAGIFYAGGVQANVLFFSRPREVVGELPATTGVWVYDFRSGVHFTRVRKPLQRSDLDDFVSSYKPRARHLRIPNDRFSYITYAEIVRRPGASMDFYPTDRGGRSPVLRDVDRIRSEIVEHLSSAMTAFEKMRF
jgi:type I restriction enzyme M protein